MSDASTRDGEVVVITGASSGLGLAATKALVSRGYFVVAAVPPRRGLLIRGSPLLTSGLREITAFQVCRRA